MPCCGLRGWMGAKADAINHVATVLLVFWAGTVRARGRAKGRMGPCACPGLLIRERAQRVGNLLLQRHGLVLRDLRHRGLGFGIGEAQPQERL